MLSRSTLRYPARSRCCAGPETVAIFAYLSAEAQHAYNASPLDEMRQCVDTFRAVNSEKYARCAFLALAGLTAQRWMAGPCVWTFSTTTAAASVAPFPMRVPRTRTVRILVCTAPNRVRYAAGQYHVIRFICSVHMVYTNTLCGPA